MSEKRASLTAMGAALAKFLQEQPEMMGFDEASDVFCAGWEAAAGPNRPAVALSDVVNTTGRFSFVDAQTGKPADLNTELAPAILARAIEQRGRVLNIEAVCEVTESAPEGCASVHREPGRTRLSFLFAAPGEDGTRPADEFVPLSPPGGIFGAEKEAFLARMAALYDEHGEPDAEGAVDRSEGASYAHVVGWLLEGRS